MAIKVLLYFLCFIIVIFLSSDRYAGYNVSFLPFDEGGVVYFIEFCKICVSIYVFLIAYGLTLSLKKYSAETTVTAGSIVIILLQDCLSLCGRFGLFILFR